MTEANPIRRSLRTSLEASGSFPLDPAWRMRLEVLKTHCHLEPEREAVTAEDSAKAPN